jgi:hypothetical protein
VHVLCSLDVYALTDSRPRAQRAGREHLQFCETISSAHCVYSGASPQFNWILPPYSRSAKSRASHSCDTISALSSNRCGVNVHKLALPAGDFKAYLFDCDGTIADTMPLHYIAWR